MEVLKQYVDVKIILFKIINDMFMMNIQKYKVNITNHLLGLWLWKIKKFVFVMGCKLLNFCRVFATIKWDEIVGLLDSPTEIISNPTPGDSVQHRTSECFQTLCFCRFLFIFNRFNCSVKFSYIRFFLSTKIGKAIINSLHVEQ